ncbi:hypothetical protein TSUD_119250 [Trifolium subterraneum]|uniref:Uncharacterized protein n=1 Tax=Trifolium subterraneum TaxID=3900 RepID=A0A2Z6P6G9_TRISU|nr:hypothetical protein TSUD_119250 [Trifolium subterraneum]
MQITMIGLFGLKLKPAASISTIPLLLFTLMFNEYCKMRFLPSFHHYSLKDAAENDELDEKCGQLEFHYENASNAYCPPAKIASSFALDASACGATGPFSIAIDDSACAASSSLSSTVFSFVDSCVDE